MFKVLAILCICATAQIATASIIPPPYSPIIMRTDVALADGNSARGVVPVRSCGGTGTAVQLRISGCEGDCQLQPGTLYDFEQDFIAYANADSITLRVDACLDSGVCMKILQIPYEYPVIPGPIYTLKFFLVPNDHFSGRRLEFRGYISHSNTGLLEICSSIHIDILSAR